MTAAYCSCELTPYGASCSCPSGTVTLDTRDVIDLPVTDLLRLTDFTVAAGDARQRGDTAEERRILAERSEFQRDALARMQYAPEGRRSDDMVTRLDDPRTDAERYDADESLDEDAAARRALRRQSVRDAISMGLDGEAAGREFDRDAAHFDAQDAAVRRNGVRRLAAADRDDDGVDW